MNETYYGGPTHREQHPFGTEVPESSLAFRSPDWVQEMTQELSIMTGGTEYISGDVEINPDPYYYVLQSYWGGAGDFVEDVATTGMAAYELARKKLIKLSGSQSTEDFISNLTSFDSDEKFYSDKLGSPTIRYSNVPLVGKIYGGPSRFYDFDLFEKNRTEVEQFDRELKKGEDVDKNYVGIEQLKVELNETLKVLDFYRKAKRQIRQIDDLIVRTNASYELDEAERREVAYFNALYYKYRGQYIDPKPEGIIPLNTIRQLLGTDE